LLNYVITWFYWELQVFISTWITWWTNRQE